ncbi:MAG: peptidase S13 [Oscillatoriales cyanobacterium]|nr:MAG: peptidase S13 [Oscillatoriales cyanobacterium]
MSEQSRWMSSLAATTVTIAAPVLTLLALTQLSASATESLPATASVSPASTADDRPSTDTAIAPNALAPAATSAKALPPATPLAEAAAAETAEAVEAIEAAEAVGGKSLLAQTTSVCSNQLAGTLSRIIDAPALRSARWGIRVETLRGGQVLFDRNSNLALIPASNMKLFVTAAALQLYSDQTPLKNSRLGSIVRTINTNSNNGFADSLFRSLGGARTVQQALFPLGVTPQEYRMNDGSGLSRSNAVQPQAFVHLLASMTNARGNDVFRSSLPVAGKTGTLRRRFRDTPAQGRVFAKTGTLRGVRALSGYLEHPLYDTLTFSVLVNQPGQNGDVLLSAIDRVVLTLARMRPCDGWDVDANPLLNQPEPAGQLRPLLPWWRPGVARPEAVDRPE